MLAAESSTKNIGKRLSNYGVAAIAAAATGIAGGTADAGQVTLPVNIPASNSNEVFIDILPFAQGAAAIAEQHVTSTYSVANPLAPNSELMLRGVSGAAQLRGQNGAKIAAFLSASSYYIYVRRVAAPFVLPPFNNGTFMYGNPSNYPPNPSLTYPGLGGGEFPVGSTNTAYFTFNNPGTGLTNGWLTIFMDSVAGSLKPTITAIHVDTGVVPEPSSMAMLCLGAAGLAAYRRRSKLN